MLVAISIVPTPSEFSGDHFREMDRVDLMNHVGGG
jgi:hypothetical protein